MIDDHRKLIVKTKENEKLELEVNFSDDPKIKECKVLRFRIGPKMFHVTRDELVSALLTIGDQKTQRKLLPTKFTRVKKLERLLHLKFNAKQDYKQGDLVEVVCPWIDEVPTEDEVFAGNLNTRKPKFYK